MKEIELKKELHICQTSLTNILSLMLEEKDDKNFLRINKIINWLHKMKDQYID